MRCTTNDVSLIELSFKVSPTWPVPLTRERKPVALIGGSASDTGRIMSISSWLRMWQW